MARVICQRSRLLFDGLQSQQRPPRRCCERTCPASKSSTSGKPRFEGNPSTQATASVNLDSNAAISAGIPAYTSKTSLVTYDNIGNKVTLDIYMIKTAANTWDMEVYNNADFDRWRLSLFERGPGYRHLHL